MKEYYLLSYQFWTNVTKMLNILDRIDFIKYNFLINYKNVTLIKQLCK